MPAGRQLDHRRSYNNDIASGHVLRRHRDADPQLAGGHVFGWTGHDVEPGVQRGVRAMWRERMDWIYMLCVVLSPSLFR